MVGALRVLLSSGADLTALELQLSQAWLPLAFLPVLLHKQCLTPELAPEQHRHLFSSQELSE